MAIIPDTEVAAIRVVADSALPEWVSVQAATLTSDTGGDYSKAWATIRRVRARIGRPTARELETEGALRDAVLDVPKWVVTLPWDDALTTRHRLVTDDGRILEVVAVDRARSFQLHVRVFCVEAR